MIRYTLFDDIKYAYPIGLDYSKENRIDLQTIHKANQLIYIDILRYEDNIAIVKMFLPSGEVMEVEFPQSQFIDCFQLRDCSDKSTGQRPIVPPVLFDGRFNS